ncbi:hypothetical protein AM1_0970 [Acaryochloris marina MBIC11017]|uniref:Uncharacterized protein n=1 Tax=Acaryochloris marina (strain MBIC 11017) TaxID=329726 RepID=B0C0N8_ACAM1|nr:hypothetical protein AM1_0970 [Acaryochloris marina MBIC11017]
MKANPLGNWCKSILANAALSEVERCCQWIRSGILIVQATISQKTLPSNMNPALFWVIQTQVGHR